MTLLPANIDLAGAEAMLLMRAGREYALKRALAKIPELREEFSKNVSVPGSGQELNQSLENAGRVADFLEFGELLCMDALHRNESCGGHFREEYRPGWRSA
jgi:succinate dehydrogenase / fumarate reductase flavoprotein subunit